MDQFVIKGNQKLSGQVVVSGAKNSILSLMVGALLAEGESVFTNVPNLIDIRMMSHLLRIIGAKVDLMDNVLRVDSTHCSYSEAPYELVSKMRASIYVLGPLLARLGKAQVSFPGGDAIGTRPVDLHLYVMRQLGAQIKVEHGYINASCDKLKGNIIDFDITSVGATVNALLATVLAEGTSEIINAAEEPEIGNLIDYLNLMGARISKVTNTHLLIEGVSSLKPAQIEVIPDRIEAGTFLLAGAITKSKITVTNCNIEHISALIKKMKEAGCTFDIKENSITVNPCEIITAIDVVTKPYPSFPTDLQAQFMAYMGLSNGASGIEDTIFPERFMHVAELNRLGANIRVKAGTALIRGVDSYSGAPVMVNDVRAGAALVLAGLAAHGETTISRIYHIDRGYDHLEEKLRLLGADIRRVTA